MVGGVTQSQGSRAVPFHPCVCNLIKYCSEGRGQDNMPLLKRVLGRACCLPWQRESWAQCLGIPKALCGCVSDLQAAACLARGSCPPLPAPGSSSGAIPARGQCRHPLLSGGWDGLARGTSEQEMLLCFLSAAQPPSCHAQKSSFSN